MKKTLLCALGAIALTLCATSSALAASSAPVTIAAGAQPAYLSQAVDASGNVIAAWVDQAVAGSDVVHWCVVAPGGASCVRGGTVTPAGGTPGNTYAYGTQVVVDGSTVVLLVNASVGNTTDESIQEWQSTDGAATFTIVNSGHAVASGNPASDTRAVSAVVLPGGSNLGFGFDTSSAAPTFHAFSLASPTQCGRQTFPVTNCGDGYATLAPSSDADQVSNEPGNFVSNGDGVLGVFRTNFAGGNFACTGGSPFGMAFTFADGLQSPSNNYNVSPGAASTAWRVPATLADCGVDYIAAGGGPSGFGVLEDNQLTGQTQFHHFSGITNTFAAAPVVISAQGEQQPAVSQDGAGGVYATFLSGGIGGPVSLAYSYDGGATWTGPAPLSADPAGSIAGLTSAVNSAGQGWASWVEHGSVFVQSFTATDAVPPSAATTLTTTAKAGAVTGTSISVPAGTTGETATATIAGANAAHALGTVTYTLYAGSGCAAASAVARSTVSVVGATASPSTPVAAVLLPGRYSWQAVYSGSAGTVQGAAGNGASTSACGSSVLTVTDPDSIAAKATTNGKQLTFGAACAVVPCTLAVAATAAAPKTGKRVAAKVRLVTVGKASFRIKRKGTQQLTFALTKAGRALVAKAHGSIKVMVTVTQRVGTHSVVTRRVLTVKRVTPRKR